MFKNLLKKSFSSKNPFDSTAHKTLKMGSNSFQYYDINTLGNICNYFIKIKPICQSQLESFLNPL